MYLLQGGSTFLLLDTLLLYCLLIIVLTLIGLLLHKYLLRGRSVLGHLTHANKHESCQTHEDDEICDTHEWERVISHMNESCRTYEYVMPHIGTKHVVSHAIWYVTHTSDNALMCVTYLTNLSRVLPWGENEGNNEYFSANSNLYRKSLWICIAHLCLVLRP